MNVLDTFVFYLIVCVGVARFQQTADVEKLLNWCIDSKLHKVSPGPESSLYGQCTPWQSRSCCTENTTKALHGESLYNFNYDHCPDKENLSPACRRHFMQDHCFYECSPNVGPWTVKETRSWRSERYYKVPLCASDCIAWFRDCMNDYTCTDNWSRNFDWVKIRSEICGEKEVCKTNICPSGSHCQTFKDIFKGPQSFCERVWDHSWEYTDDDKPCMRLWFDGTYGNPNDNVAKWKALAIAAGNAISFSASIVAISLLVTYFPFII